MQTDPTREEQIFGEAFALGTLVAMFGWAALGWSSAPDQMPMHWNIHGEVNRYVDRAGLRVKEAERPDVEGAAGQIDPAPRCDGD